MNNTSSLPFQLFAAPCEHAHVCTKASSSRQCKGTVPVRYAAKRSSRISITKSSTRPLVALLFRTTIRSRLLEGARTFRLRCVTRVIARTELARGQLYLEGQVISEPSRNPSLYGGSIGIGGEYQEPHFYAGGAVRFTGTSLSGTGRTASTSRRSLVLVGRLSSSPHRRGSFAVIQTDDRQRRWESDSQ